MKIIDVHIHALPYPEPLEKDVKEAALEYYLSTGINITHYACEEDVLRELDRVKIEKGFILPRAGKDIKKTNNFVSSLRRTYINGFATLDPNFTEGIEELYRAIKELGLIGIVFDLNKQEIDFSDQSMWMFMEEVKVLKVPIYIHMDYLDQKRINTEDVNELVTCFSDVNFFFSHFAKYENKDMPSIMPEPNVYYDTSHVPKRTLENFIEQYGVDNIIYGSDFKYNFYPEYEIKKIKELDVGEREKEKIFYFNIYGLI